MATLAKRKVKNGFSIYIQFILNGERKTLTLGLKYTQKQADEIKLYVEKVVRCIETGGEPDKRTALWLDEMADDLRKRFERAGLIEANKDLTLENIIDAYYQEKERGFSANTLGNKTTNTNRLMKYFGKDCIVDEISTEAAEEFRDVLLRPNSVFPQAYPDATVGGAVKVAHALFAWAVKKKLMRFNPFDGVSAPSMVNKDREHTITREDYQKILEHCPDQTWRALVTLCRIGGLRNPSETTELRWSDVLWGEGKLVVRSRKNKRYKGKGVRVIPLWEEIRTELADLREVQEASGDYSETGFIIDRYREKENQRTQFERILHRAGLEQWPRIFHNLRGSRSNEVFSAYSEHLAVYWMNQSKKVAQSHYLHATEEDFEMALKIDCKRFGIQPEKKPEKVMFEP